MINRNEYLEKRLNGADYSSIKKELSSQGYSDAEVNEAINDIDTKYLTIINQKQNKSLSNILNGVIRLIIGGGLLLLGILILIGMFVYSRIGLLDAFILIFCLSSGSWLFASGKKILAQALKKKVKVEKSNSDILDF